MYMFINERGQVAVAKSDVVQRVIFSMDELSNSFRALVTGIRITPKPVVSVHGTIGGANFLNVFGEDPLQIEINGVAIGYNCDSLSETESAISNSVEFYKTNSVINRVEPIRFTLPSTGKSERQAFLVAMSVLQDNAFADLAKFSMILLAEDLNNRRFDRAGIVVPTGAPNVFVPPNTGRPGSWAAQRPTALITDFSVTSQLLTRSGDVVARTPVNLSGNNLTPTSSNIR
jgi:hypothetical protein